MKICQNCGTQNNDNNYMCTQCQTQLTTSNIFLFREKTELTINIFGIINGIISIVLGVVSYCTSYADKEARWLLMEEGKEYGAMLHEVYLAPAKSISFASGSLLVILGLFICLFFIIRIQKGKLIKN